MAASRVNEFQSAGVSTTLNPPGTVIEHNLISGGDVGIYLFGSEGCCETHGNAVIGHRFFGIVVHDGQNETRANTIVGGEVGIAAVAASVDAVAVSKGDTIARTFVAPVEEIESCGFTATVTRSRR